MKRVFQSFLGLLAVAPAQAVLPPAKFTEEFARAVRNVTAIAKKTFEGGAYRLTPELFVYRAGRTERFKPAGN